MHYEVGCLPEQPIAASETSTAPLLPERIECYNLLWVFLQLDSVLLTEISILDPCCEIWD